MTSDAEIRRFFPYLERVLYLNTASAGISWSGAGRASAEFYNDALGKGINGLPDWQAKALGLRLKLAALLQVRLDAVGFIGSTTEAMNLTAHSIRFNPGDEVLLAQDEFPSVIYPWLQVAAADPQVTVVPIPVPCEEDRESVLIGAITENTRVLAVSHVHWCTGTTLDLHRLGAACKSKGALLVVDGVQALGAIPVRLGDDVDVYCASVFKWMISGFGLAVWIVSDRALNVMEPAQRGYENPPPELKLRYSHWNYPGIFALAGTMQLLEDFGWDSIYQRVADLSHHLSDGLRSRGYGVSVPERARAGIVSFTAKDPALLCRQLQEREVFVAERGGLVRASPHFYNTHEEIDRFLEIVDELAPRNP